MLPSDNAPNRLINEKSPYLQQHAYNPVDWHPWGEEAFAKAKVEDKPVFLSIGYSTCHWCHVMEEESFEDIEVAERLNHSFVAIKVDREERPDIDSIYMTVCQMMNGSGGWPLNLMLTPDKKPFFAGTYFPKHSRPPQIGLLDLLDKVDELWAERRSELLASADSLIGLLKRGQARTAGQPMGPSILDHAFRGLEERFDPEYSGFRPAPKFPSPHTILFLLRYARRTGNNNAQTMARRTLTAMRLGGLFDHVGFGFHRYSTDEQWLLPHFEKMLYDQALLAMAYTEGFQATGEELFARTACEIFTYVQRDLCSMEGGFYCAEDADSEGEEGKFYVWTEEELEEALEPEQAKLAKRVFNTAPEGNFREARSGEKTGTNILHLSADYAEDLDASPQDGPPLNARLEVIRETLFMCREARVRPGLDDKILTDWNGLMIAALAMGARVFSRESYLRSAVKAASFVLEFMRDDQGRLLHRYREGEAAVMALLDDHAHLIWGLIELYQSSLDPCWLKEAVALAETCMERFWDPDHGGFFLEPADGETVLVRQKEIYDGALPSGNSVMYNNLLRLARLTGRDDFEQRANTLQVAFSGVVSPHPGGFLQFLSGVDASLGPSGQLVIVGDRDLADTAAMLHMVHSTYAPHIDVLLKEPGDPGAIEALAPLTRGKTTPPDTATASLCLDKACHPPVTDPDALRELLLSTGKREEV